MLSVQRIEPIKSTNLFSADVADKVTVTAYTEFMLKELKNMFKKEDVPDVGCQLDPSLD
jgi:hypothetical protein